MTTKLNLAVQEAAQITPKSREEEDALNAVRAQRPRAIELVNDVIDELRHSTRKLEPGTARDILRSYGVEFESLEGEEPDNPPPAGGNTPPPVP